MKLVHCSIIGLVGIAVLLLTAGNAFSQDFQLSAHIFRDACASPSVQCSGFPSEPAMAGNDQPVFITVQVSAKAQTQIGEVWLPLKGLPSSLFQIQTQFVGPGGANVQKMTCSDCFQSTGGTYRIWIEPIDGADWVAGLYTLQVSIPFDGMDILPAIAHMEIPAN